MVQVVVIQVHGGYGVIALDNKKILYQNHEIDNSNVTNNQMELKALIEAIKLAIKYKKEHFIIYSDSAYCVNMCNIWIWNWANNNWKNSKKQQVENYNLVRQLYDLLNTFQNFVINKTHGHMSIIGNELADALATNNFKKFNKIKSENELEYDLILDLR